MEMSRFHIRLLTAARQLRSALLFLILALTALSCGQQQAAQQGAGAKPRLVLLLVVDQMTPEYISRLDTLYRHGFRTLIDSSALFLRGKHDHAMTATAPGHATIGTGAHPARHGITGNDYYDRASFSRRYNAEDSAVTVVPHGDDKPMSPKNLLGSTLGDWLKEQSPGSKLFGVALKDRSAIMLAGKRADAAYWYHDKSGDFVTSTFYRSNLPSWVEAFNASNASELYRDSAWERIGPETVCGFCSPDSFPAEFDGKQTTFPHSYHQHGTGSDSIYREELTRTPFGDHFTLAFAESLVVHEQLGADEITDVLCVSLSAADITGHAFGPDSHEMTEFYLRLDRYLGDFVSFLKERVGSDRLLIALSSDHGVLPLPEFLMLQGYPAMRVPANEYRDSVTAALASLDLSDLTSNAVNWKLFGTSLYLDSTAANLPESSLEQIRLRMAQKLRSVPFIADVFTWDELRSGQSLGRPYETMFRNNFHPERVPDLIVRTREYALVTSSLTGTNHGSPYDYDSYVPILFHGAGIKSGIYPDTILTIDIAPTLAHLIGVKAGEQVDGQDVGSLFCPL